MEPNNVFIYFIVFFFVFLLNLIAGKATNKKARFFLPLLSFALLVLFVGFRENVGTDFNTYANTYNMINEVSLQEAMGQQLEPTIVILYKSLSNIFNDYHWIYFMYAILSILPIYLANKEYKNKYLAYSVLIFCFMFFPFTLNIMRQGVSFGFTLLSAVCLTKKKNKKAIISFLIGLAFHSTTIMVAPFLFTFYFLQKKKKEKSYSKYALFLTLIASFAIMYLLKDLFIEHDVRYSAYLTQASYANISFASIVTYLPSFIVLFLQKNNVSNVKDETLNLYIGMFCTGVIFQIVGTIAPYVNRIALFFLPVLAIYMPIVIQNIKNSTLRKWGKFGLLVYLIAFFILEYIVWNRNEILPYQTWLML